MTIAFSSEPMGHPKSDDFKQVGVLTQQANGLFTVESGPTSTLGIAPINPGTILGVMPDGTYVYGPTAAIGNGQQFKFEGGFLTVHPNISINDGSVLGGGPTIAYVIAARVVA